MKFNKISLAAVTAVAALTLAACGNSDSPGGDGTAAAGGTKLKIGIKFDQPGLGLKKGSDYTGFDIDVARYVAKKLGANESDITWVQAISSQREDMIENGQVDFIVGTYSITDKRKQRVSFAGPYFIAGQDLLVRADDTSITGPESLANKKLCSVKGSTPAQNVKDKYANTVQLQEFGGYSECLPPLLNGGLDAMTTDDTILAGFAAQPEYAGKLKVVGKPFSEEKYGIGIKKGDKAQCEKITAAINDMIKDGSWQKSLDANLGPAGYKPSSANPPTPAACA